MTTRHRVPTVFTLYMVDVLCCALGCVILLWFLKLHEAKDYTHEAQRRLQAADEEIQRRQREESQVSDQLAAAQGQLEETTQAAADALNHLQAAEQRERDVSSRLQDSQRRAQALEKDRDQVRHERDAVNATAADLKKQLMAQGARNATIEEQLAAAGKRSADLESQLKNKEAAVQSASNTVDDLSTKLREATAHLKEAQTQADQVPTLQAEAKGARDRVAALEKELEERKTALANATRGMENLGGSNQKLTDDLSARNRELAVARGTISLLESEKQALSDKVLQERAAGQNRFAGITLSGRRVVFLVDMSGSMELVDERTLAPEKWSGVRETLAKIMRSLPGLEKYQVVLFSDKVTYLLGGEEGWLDFDAGSAGRVTEALTKVKPKGGTNMYAASDAAFRYRRQGLDTVYLLSDGLPNMGEGLSDEQAKGLKETEQAEILGKYVRRKLRTDWNRE
ncbi:MAG: VWA domain-containing protein, partial [Planctomycetes bacterium]|nr:VWA domain-containing protein [Planctomycetota bacterium]